MINYKIINNNNKCNKIYETIIRQAKIKLNSC